jgi:hypothetical protein
MKNAKYYLLMLIISFYCYDLCAQEKPVLVSPLIGYQLDKAERDKYHLFQDIQDFQSAVFFLNPDSTLKAKISFVSKGLLKDTIIEKYKTLSEMQDLIEKSHFVQVQLKDGSFLQGEILKRNNDTLFLKTELVGTLCIPSSKIENLVESNPETPYSPLLKDPNQTRAFLMPSGITLPGGKGYVADYELFFFTTAVGLTDWLMINGGFLLLPIDVENQMLNFGFKALLLKPNKKLSIAAGWQFFTIPDSKTSPSSVGYGVVSLGDEDGKLNFGFGGVFGTNSSDKNLLFCISGDQRVSNHIKLLFEGWILPDAEFTPLIVGVRFFGSNLSGDIGLLYPIGESISSPIGYPVVNLVYNF